jgi:hypothetical protein
MGSPTAEGEGGEGKAHQEHGTRGEVPPPRRFLAKGSLRRSRGPFEACSGWSLADHGSAPDALLSIRAPVRVEPGGGEDDREAHDDRQ